jgi:hypothetical protein
LISLFQQFGNCEVEFYRRFAYIKFLKDSDAKNALSEWNGKEFDGTRLKVEFSQRKPAGYLSPESSGSEKFCGDEEMKKSPSSAGEDSSSEEEVVSNNDLLVVPLAFQTKTPPNTPNQEIVQNAEIKEEVFLRSTGKGGLMQEVTGNDGGEVEVRQEIGRRDLKDDHLEKEVVLVVQVEESLVQDDMEIDHGNLASDTKDLENKDEIFMQVDNPSKQAEEAGSEHNEEIEFEIEGNLIEQSIEEVKPKTNQVNIVQDILSKDTLIKSNPATKNPTTVNSIQENLALETVEIPNPNNKDSKKDPLTVNPFTVSSSPKEPLSTGNIFPVKSGIKEAPETKNPSPSKTEPKETPSKETPSKENPILKNPPSPNNPSSEKPKDLQDNQPKPSITENPSKINPVKEKTSEVNSISSNFSKDKPLEVNPTKVNPIKENLSKPVVIEEQLTQVKKNSGSIKNDQTFITPIKLQVTDQDKQLKKTSENSQLAKELIKNQLFDPAFVERELKKVNELCCKSEEKSNFEDIKAKEIGIKQKPLQETEIKTSLTPKTPQTKENFQETEPKVSLTPKTPQPKEIMTETPSKSLEKKNSEKEHLNLSPFDKMKVERPLVPFNDPFIQPVPEPEKEKPSIILEMAKKSSEKSKTSRKVVTEELKAEISPVRRKIKMPRKERKTEKSSPEKITPEVEQSIETPKSKTSSNQQKKQPSEEKPKTRKSFDLPSSAKEEPNSKKNQEIPQNRSRRSRADPSPVISKDLHSKDLQSKDLQSKDLQSKDLQSKDLQSKDLQSKDLQSKDLQSKDLQPLPNFLKVLKASSLKPSEKVLASQKIPRNSLRFIYDIIDDETVSIAETAFRVKKLCKEFSDSLASCCVCGKEMKLKSALVHLQSKFHIESS